MTAQPPDTRHDATSASALAAIAAHNGPILLDLDETLYLRNSTEDFIDTARPAFLAFLLLHMLGALAPWRWTGGDATRDVWRVGLVMICFPWTLLLWRRRVSKLATAYANRDLVSSVDRRPDPPIVATIGFRPVVMPLVAALGLSEAKLVASRAFSLKDRRSGKLKLAADALSLSVVERSLVVTDSFQDLPLLDICTQPMRVIWPGARYRPAFEALYYPGRYISKVKRPNASYIANSIVKDEFPIWVLCSVGLAAFPLLHVVALAMLALSFWAVYELGYVDNDFVAATYESDPRLSDGYQDHRISISTVHGWTWAGVSGAVAVWLVSGPIPVWIPLLTWAAVLIATASLFRLYNRLDKETRVWLFAGLQLARSAAFVTVVAVVPAATAAIGAHVLSKWLPYFIYRLRGDGEWPPIACHMIRLSFFAVLLSIQSLVSGIGPMLNWSTLGLAVFFAFKARRELAQVLAGARRLDRAHNPDRS